MSSYLQNLIINVYIRCMPIYIYIYIYIMAWLRKTKTKPLSSCHAASTDLPDPLSPLVSIVHRSRQVFLATSCTATKLL